MLPRIPNSEFLILNSEDLLELVRRRDFELIVTAVGGRLVGPPALKDRGVPESPPLHVIVFDLADALDAQRLPRQILAGAPAALTAGHARRLAAVHLRPVAPRVLLQCAVAQR